MTRIWWLVPFVLQWDGKLCRATYLWSNCPSLHCNPVEESFVRLHQTATLSTSTRKYNWLCRLCMCIRCVHPCVCVVYVLLSKAPQALYNSWLNGWQQQLDHRTENATERKKESLRFLSLFFSILVYPPSARHGGQAQSAWSWNEISGRYTIFPPLPLFWTTPNPTWTPTGTQRAAWLHVPTMRPHKKHQLSRTGRSFLRRLSMQLCSPPLPTSQSGSGEYNVVSVVVQFLQGKCGDTGT